MKEKKDPLAELKKGVNSYFNAHLITTADENGDHFYEGVENAESLVLLIPYPGKRRSRRAFALVARVQFNSVDKIHFLVYKKHLSKVDFLAEKHRAALLENFSGLEVDLSFDEKDEPVHNQKFYWKKAFPKK